MHSNRSEHGHSRPYHDRSSRQWNTYEDRREWLDPHRDGHWDSQSKNGVNGHGSSWRTGGSRGYSDSPTRLDSKDSLNRERSRMSPVRRRMSSPDRGPYDHKRRRFAGIDEEDYRSRRILDGNASRRSPNTWSHSHSYQDLKHTLPQEEDFIYSKESQESRHGYRHEESSPWRQCGDLSGQSSGYCNDRDGQDRSWDQSFGGARPQDHPVKYCESDGHQKVADPEQKRSTKGFQRFLDILNKGVNISTLNTIMTQTSTNEDDQSQSPMPFMNTGDHSWSPGFPGGQQRTQQISGPWNESEGSPRRASPPPGHRSASPKKCSLSDKESLMRLFSTTSRSKSLSEVETTSQKPEYKHKHMQDVLQAIGINLGFEELGRMSHRIQERLYGKRDGDGDTVQAFSQMPESSSAGPSHFSPAPQHYYTTNESHSAQVEGTGGQQIQADPSIQCDNNSNVVFREGEKFEMESQQNAAYQPFSQNPSCPPVNCSPHLYAAPPSPSLPHAGPQLHLPFTPPSFHYPQGPPLNVYPGGQASQSVPQHHHPQPAFQPKAQSASSSHKPKTQSRPRCLQVIRTKKIK